jgi:hypothetical protein
MIYTSIDDLNRRLEKKPWCPMCGSLRVTNSMEYNKIISFKCNGCKRYIHLWKIQMNDKNRGPYMYYFQQEDGEMFLKVMAERAVINKLPTQKWINNHVFDRWKDDQEFQLMLKLSQ